MIDATPLLSLAHTALLVMDYQPNVLQRLSDADSLLAPAARAVAAGRRRGITIGYVHVALTASEVNAVPPTNKTFARLRESGAMFQSDSPATAVHERVAPQSGDIVVRKTRVGAFSTTDLDNRLRDRGIDTLMLAGVSTSGVVLSTVRDAADRDYRLVVLRDLCADADADVHALLMDRVFPRQADVVTSDWLEQA
jgi:nicotinamidase-related amidase